MKIRLTVLITPGLGPAVADLSIVFGPPPEPGVDRTSDPSWSSTAPTTDSLLKEH